MSQKSFKTSFDSILLGQRDEEKNKIKKITSTQEIRATFIVNKSYIERLKAISYWERKLIKTIINEAFVNYIEKYEKDNGPIKLPK